MQKHLKSKNIVKILQLTIFKMWKIVQGIAKKIVEKIKKTIKIQKSEKIKDLKTREMFHILKI